MEDVNNSAGLVDGTIDTNLGMFRAYMKMWLDANPSISHGDDCFVTTLAQSPTGIPLQIYCFTATSSWFPYEGIQAAVFEHLAAMLHRFNLYTFENPSGRDTLIDGYLSPGKNPAPLFGLPTRSSRIRARRLAGNTSGKYRRTFRKYRYACTCVWRKQYRKRRQD